MAQRALRFFLMSFILTAVGPISAVAESCGALVAGHTENKSPLTEIQIARVLDAVRDTFQIVKYNPQVLPKKWLALNNQYDVASVGFCATATNAVYHLLGGKNAGLTPMVATYHDPELLKVDPSSGGRASHWWLRDADGKFIDVTKDQYTAFGETPPYHLGKGAGFNRPLTVPTIAGKIIIQEAIRILHSRGYRSDGTTID